MRKSFIALVFLAFCPFIVAQQALNNDAVIKLVKAGLSDDLIVSTINASPAAFDAGASGLIALKSAGVSDKVVTAIVVKSSAGATPAVPGDVASTAPAGTNPDDPAAARGGGAFTFTTQALPQARKWPCLNRRSIPRERPAASSPPR